MEGALAYVNIDPASANYLADTMVYSFFDYEVGQGSYCKSIRVCQSERSVRDGLGQGRVGQRRVFMARNGENYEVRPENPPNEPGNCNPWDFEGRPMDKIYGRMFALRPTDAADLSKPWTYALGYDESGQARARDSSTPSSSWGGRSTGTRTASASTRRAFAGPPRDPDPAARCTSSGLARNWVRASSGRCSTGPTGPAALLPLDTFGNSIALYSGLHGSTDPLVPDSPPRIFTYTRGDMLDQQAALNGWWTDFKRFRGANMSLLSRRLFANGGDESDCLFEARVPVSRPRSRRWTPPSATRSACSSARTRPPPGSTSSATPAWADPWASPSPTATWSGSAPSGSATPTRSTSTTASPGTRPPSPSTRSRARTRRASCSTWAMVRRSASWT